MTKQRTKLVALSRKKVWLFCASVKNEGEGDLQTIRTTLTIHPSESPGGYFSVEFVSSARFLRATSFLTDIKGPFYLHRILCFSGSRGGSPKRGKKNGFSGTGSDVRAASVM